jgi:hypothetical protein
MVVGLLAISLWLGKFGVTKVSESECRLISWRDISAGSCCGLALASEYSAGIVVFGIILCFVLSSFKRLLSLALGMTPPLMLIPTYHWICFGTPFTIAYHHEAIFTEMHQGFFGIQWPPNAQHAFSLLFSPEQGLFFWSCFLLVAFFGYSPTFAISHRLFGVAYLVPLLQVGAISAYFLPSGGGMLGPRFLAPILVVMALPTAMGIARFPRVGCILASVSITITVLATIIDVAPPPSENPLFEFYLTAFIEGTFSHNLGLVVGLPSHASLLPFLFGLTSGAWLGWQRLPGITNSRVPH